MAMAGIAFHVDALRTEFFHVKNVINQTTMESEKKRDVQVAKKIDKTVVKRMKICATEAYCGPVKSAVLLTKKLMTDDLSSSRVVTGYMRIDTIRAIVFVLLIKAISKTFLLKSDLKISTDVFVSNYIKKDSCVAHER